MIILMYECWCLLISNHLFWQSEKIKLTSIMFNVLVLSLINEAVCWWIKWLGWMCFWCKECFVVCCNNTYRHSCQLFFHADCWQSSLIICVGAIWEWFADNGSTLDLSRVKPLANMGFRYRKTWFWNLLLWAVFLIVSTAQRKVCTDTWFSLSSINKIMHTWTYFLWQQLRDPFKVNRHLLSRQ